MEMHPIKKLRKEMFYFMMHSVNFIYGYVVEQLVKDHSDSEKRKETGCHQFMGYAF